ncbi:sensor histidine kinase [Lachnoclostridium sp.]|uniref:sensor histidine kinase n=1 Tax=Lachnoclostridium sp. TaxID=2028282 RepID=UPI00289DC91D|nr:HAMP domain-containing sensor histidine kinase [Lachnoclostridium sp.]
MKKLKLTLRWRVTLITILVMLISSVAIVIFININISRIMPEVTNTLIVVTSGSTNLSPSQNKSEPFYSSGSATLDSNPLSGYNPNNITGESASAQANIITDTMHKAKNDMYLWSLIILFAAISVGGIVAYFIVGRALRPVRLLSRKIKDVNSHNLTEALPMAGPNDEIKELTLSFNSMLSKLENAFSSQQRFNVNVAHELKTPLAVLKLNIDVLNEMQEKTPNDYNDTLAIVEQTAMKMNAMIEALLDTARQENASLDDDVDLKEVVSDVAEDLQPIAKKKEVEIICNIKPVPIFKGNEVLLYRAIYNIVENAIKYNQQGGSVSISLREHEHQIELNINDTGNGIATEELQHIFEPLYRIKKEMTDGYGLGLALTKSAIAIHAGEINVTSKLGQGTKFDILIPIIR